jgi:hypothetical protein
MTRNQLLRELDILPEVLDFWADEFGDCGFCPTIDGDFEAPAVRMAFFLKRLLRDEGFTLWGARRRLQGCDFSKVPQPTGRPSSDQEQAGEEAGRRTRELIALLDEHLQSP